MKNRLFTTLLFGVLIGLAACSRKTPDLQGFWEGSIQAGEMKLRIVLKITKMPDGKYSGTMDSVDQGGKGLPATIVTKENSFRAELKTPPAVYEGNLNQAGTEIIGYWRQGGSSLPLTLKRTTQPSKIPEAKTDSEYVQRGKSELHGYWNGTLAVKGMELRLALKIAEEADGKFSAMIDSIDQGSKNLPASGIDYSKPNLKIEFAGIGGKFDGKINNDASEISGTWMQLGQTNPLIFKRGEPLIHDESKKDYSHSRENDPQGFWKGTLDLKKAQLRIVVKIAKLPDGTFSALMDSIDQGAKNLPATSVDYKEPSINIAWKAFDGLYEGKIENGKMSGTWKQGTNAFPLGFERTTKDESAK